MAKQDIKKIIEAHPVYFFLGILATGFLAGLGTYKSILEIAQLKTLREGSYVLLKDLDKSHLKKQDVGISSKENKIDCSTALCIDEKLLKERFVTKEIHSELLNRRELLEENFIAYQSNFDISNFNSFDIVKSLSYYDNTRLSRYKIERPIDRGYFARNRLEDTFPFFKISSIYVDTENTGWVIPGINFGIFLDAYVNDKKNGNNATISLYMPDVENKKILVRGGEKWNFKFKGKEYRFEICSLNYISAMTVRLIGVDSQREIKGDRFIN